MESHLCRIHCTRTFSSRRCDSMEHAQLQSVRFLVSQHRYKELIKLGSNAKRVSIMLQDARKQVSPQEGQV